MRTVYLLLVFVVFAGCSLPQRAQNFGDTQVAWVSLEEGASLAQTSDKPLLVDFFVREGCGRCEKMDANLYNNEQISSYINSHFVPVRIDLDGTLTSQEAALGKRYEYRYECLLLVLDSNLNVINDEEAGNLCFASTLEPEAFIGYLERTVNKM